MRKRAVTGGEKERRRVFFSRLERRHSCDQRGMVVKVVGFCLVGRCEPLIMI